MGNTEKDDADIALDFLYGLCADKYSAFTAKILNDVSKGAIKHPKDINAVFILANTRVVVSRGSKHNHGATFSTIEAHSRQVESAQNKETAKASKGRNQPKKTSDPQRNKKKTIRNNVAAPASWPFSLARAI